MGVSGKVSAEWCDVRARARASLGGAFYLQEAEVYRIAAATLRWYAKTETGGDDHAERQAMRTACKEATSE